MCEIRKHAAAGTMESSDAYVEIDPAPAGITIELESVVEAQFGDSIRASAEAVLRDMGIANARLTIVDRGALDCVLRARVETAALRGKGE